MLLVLASVKKKAKKEVIMSKISVIVPVYNVEKYLRRCIDSILAQTFSDFELILVDDGSPDNCGKICDEYAVKDHRVHVIHKENGGVSKARNAALDVATGEYICFCDSDDYLKNDYLETLFNTLVETKSDCVSCNCTLVDDIGEKEVWTWNSKEYRLINPLEKEVFIKDVVLKNKIIWAMWGRIFKKKIIEENYIRVCETCENFAEDLGFFLMYYVHCDNAVHIDYAGYFYYQRDNSIMSKTMTDIKLNALNEVSFAFFEHIKKLNDDNEIIQNYPIIHFWIMYNQFQRLWNGKGDFASLPIECRKIVKIKWYKKMIKRFVFLYKEPIVLYGENKTYDYKNLCFYTLHNNYRLFCILDVLHYKLKRK